MPDPSYPIRLKRHAWANVTRGAIMRMALDLETSGLSQRSGVPYATPNYAFITGYGSVLGDLNFRPLRRTLIKPRRPPWKLPEPIALMKQRYNGRMMSPEDLDDPALPDYFAAMGGILWDIEQAPLAYGAFEDPQRIVTFDEYDTRFKENRKKEDYEKGRRLNISESVIPIPLLDDRGNVCYDVRYHPSRQRVSYRFDKIDSDSRYYNTWTNLVYQDKEDGSWWRWVNPSFDSLIHNAKFDLGELRANLMAAGCPAEDAVLLYAPAAPTSKRNAKNHVIDTMYKFMAAALYGEQTEDGFQFGELIDEAGCIRQSVSLPLVLDSNARQPNRLRMVNGGIFLPDDSKPDSALAHGADDDAWATFAADRFVTFAEPEISAMVEEQANDKKRRKTLLAHSPDDEHLPLFSMSFRLGGTIGEAPYFWIGDDSGFGDFKNHIFILADGSLPHIRFHEKAPHELSGAEMVAYLEAPETRRNPKRAVRQEKIRHMPAVVPLKYVLEQTSQGVHYHANMDGILATYKYIGEHPEMVERVYHAMAVINYKRRHEERRPQTRLIEDDFQQLFGLVPYLEKLEDIRRQVLTAGGPTAKKSLDRIETIRNASNNAYDTFMTAIDRAGYKLCLTGHIIDGYRGASLDDRIHEGDSDEARHALKVLNNFIDTCEKQYNVYKTKKCAYLEILQGLRKPDNTLYFEDGHFTAQTIGEALHFREMLGLRAIEDIGELLHSDQSDIVDGLSDKFFCVRRGGDGRLLFLFADADNGQAGASPHVIDAMGRELDIEHLLSLPDEDFNRELIDTNRWNIRFHRLVSEMTLTLLTHRFAAQKKLDLLPSWAHALYEGDRQLRFHGFPNEDPSHSRIPTLETIKDDLRRLSSPDGDPRMSEARMVLDSDEGHRWMANFWTWIKKQEEANPRDPLKDFVAGFDDRLAIPYDNIPNLVDRDPAVPLEKDPHFVLVDIPLRHAHTPRENNDAFLPPRSLVVPSWQVKKIHDGLRSKKPILVRIPETGQIYFAARPDLYILTSDHVRADGRLTVDEQNLRRALSRSEQGLHVNLVDQARADYRNAGQELTGRDVYILGAENFYPVAATRGSIITPMQTLRLPHVQFYGLTAPHFVGYDSAVTGTIMPADYLLQTFTPGNPLLLREMDATSFSHIYGEKRPETGHTHVTRLTHAINELGAGHDDRGLSMRELFAETGEEGAKLDAIAQREGFFNGADLRHAIADQSGLTGPDHLRKIMDDWGRNKWKSNWLDQRFVPLLWEPVRPETWGLQMVAGTDEDKRRSSVPQAAFRYGKQPVSPSAYRAIAYGDAA